MESLFFSAFGEEDFLAALEMTGSEAFFNKLLTLNGDPQCRAIITAVDAIRNYGLLTRTIGEHGPQSGGNPHNMLFVQTGTIKYRVAINAEPTKPGKGPPPPTLQYQIVRDLRLAGVICLFSE
jgi:hypothetical protein